MQVKNIPARERIILALDVSSGDEAMDLVERLEPEITFFKVGLQLFLAAGFSIVDWITGRGHKVMLDLKFYDIPRTVELAVRQLNGRGITFATAHGSRAVAKAASLGAQDVGILAVTVLTSIGQEEMEEMGSSLAVKEVVLKRALGAREAGCKGIVCSPKEVKMVRQKTGEDLIVVTPGIRLKDQALAVKDDQVRIADPFSAITNGSDYLVIGRPIRDAPDPLKTAGKIRGEIERALEAISR